MWTSSYIDKDVASVTFLLLLPADLGYVGEKLLPLLFLKTFTSIRRSVSAAAGTTGVHKAAIGWTQNLLLHSQYLTR